MPRRVYTYPANMGWADWNLLSTLGAYLIGVSVLLFIVNVAKSLRTGMPAGDNPWGAPDLEWATSSPPPPYNFADLPLVEGSAPLWSGQEAMPAVTGLGTDRREVLLTDAVEAAPQIRWILPEPSLWPLLSALGLTVMFVWSIFSPWGVVWGAILPAIGLTVWFWPKKPQSETKVRA
jgi:hypothetical protein